MSGQTYLSTRIATRLQPRGSVAPYRAISVLAEVGQPTILLRLENGHERNMLDPRDSVLWAVQGHRFMDASTARLLAKRLIECADLIEPGSVVAP